MTDWLGAHPDLVIVTAKIVVMLLLLLTAIAYAVWFERKAVAHIQSRWGPYRVGPHGLLQPLADGLKFLFKEDINLAQTTSRFAYLVAPFLSVTLAWLAIAVIPFGPAHLPVPWLDRTTGLAIADIHIGLLFVLAVTSLGVYGVALAGWASNSKYPLMGALRSAAQMVSYELALTVSVIGVLLLANTLSLREIVEAQAGHWRGWVPRWYLWPQCVAFISFFIAGVAETNRLPFDLPEAESELVAGYHTEYSSLKFVMFYLAEYAHIITLSFLVTILFLGGWLSPFPSSAAWAWSRTLPALGAAGIGGFFLLDLARLRNPAHRLFGGLIGLALWAVAGVLALEPVLEVVEGPFWFLSKTALFVFIFIWIRGTLPRFRYDQLMGFGWKFLLPLAVGNVLITSLVIVWRAN